MGVSVDQFDMDGLVVTSSVDVMVTLLVDDNIAIV